MEETNLTLADEQPQEQSEQSAQQSTEQTKQPAKKGAKEFFKNYFTATRIAYIAIFTALSFALRLAQFTVLPLPIVERLKLDFSDVFVLIGAYALGPVAGMIIMVLKELIYGICFSSSAFAGEFANILIMSPYILIPSIIYKKHKGIKSVLIWLAVGCVVQVLWSFPVNLFFSFPVFVGFNWKLGMNIYLQVWYWAMLFNLIKTVSLSIIAMLLYKPLSRLIKLTSEKFDKRRNPRKA